MRGSTTWPCTSCCCAPRRGNSCACWRRGRSRHPTCPPAHSSRLGYFEEYALASREPVADGACWERLGFVAFDPVTEPYGKVVACSRDLNVGFYDLDLGAPALVFSAADMGARIAALREQGHRFARRLPRALAASGAAILEAPEGTQLLLVSDES